MLYDVLQNVTTFDSGVSSMHMLLTGSLLADSNAVANSRLRACEALQCIVCKAAAGQLSMLQMTPTPGAAAAVVAGAAVAACSEPWAVPVMGCCLTWGLRCPPFCCCASVAPADRDSCCRTVPLTGVPRHVSPSLLQLLLLLLWLRQSLRLSNAVMCIVPTPAASSAAVKGSQGHPDSVPVPVNSPCCCALLLCPAGLKGLSCALPLLPTASRISSCCGTATGCTAFTPLNKASSSGCGSCRYNCHSGC